MRSALTAYGTNVNLGSPGKVYDLLVQAAKAHPVAGNADGSYLTMRSKEGAVFFVINIVGNFVSIVFSCLLYCRLFDQPIGLRRKYTWSVDVK